MQQIVFVRNVNAGQRGHPSTADLVGAFVEAGFVGVESFQSNGTLVMEGADAAEDAAAASSAGEDRLEFAMQALAARSGISREAFALPICTVIEIVAEHASSPTWQRRELTLHGDGSVDATSPTLTREAAPSLRRRGHGCRLDRARERA